MYRTLRVHAPGATPPDRSPRLLLRYSAIADRLIATTAAELGRSIAARTVSSEELTQSYLAEIERHGAAVNAVVQVDPEGALTAARDADRRLAAVGPASPLHGVPFTVKDVLDVAGLIGAVGIEERASHVASADATVVARLRAAGAIPLGKTNCPPGGGGGRTDNPVYGPTRNPYDHARQPGGSSGGEAAAVAAVQTGFGLGSDSGGSLRVPAHFCGVATLKPTTGRVPNTGAYEHPGGVSDLRTQIGPIARGVEDLALVLAVIAGEDGYDTGVVPVPFEPRWPAVSGLRAAVVLDTGLPACQAVTATLAASARALRAGGIAVEERETTVLGQARPLTERWWEIEELGGADVVRLFADWDAYRVVLLGLLSDADCVVCPVDANLAPRQAERPESLFDYTLGFSLGGWPCAVVRAGTSAEGLPVGVQIAARPWREEIVLAVAARLERELGGWALPPG